MIRSKFMRAVTETRKCFVWPKTEFEIWKIWKWKSMRNFKIKYLKKSIRNMVHSIVTRIKCKNLGWSLEWINKFQLFIKWNIRWIFKFQRYKNTISSKNLNFKKLEKIKTQILIVLKSKNLFADTYTDSYCHWNSRSFNYCS